MKEQAMNDTIYSINGPVVTLRGARGFSMMEWCM